MISAAVGVNSSLLIEPAQTLAFPLDTSASDGAKPTTTVSACLTLTNISARKHVVFKVRTTKVDMFLVKPAQGVIEPERIVTVVVTIVPTACGQLTGMTSTERDAVIERFLIQSIDCSDDMRAFNGEDLSAFWKRIPKELITNKKLTCRFVEAAELALVHLPRRQVDATTTTTTTDNRNHNNPIQCNHIESPVIDQKSFHRQRIPSDQPKQPQRQQLPSFAPSRSQTSGSYKAPSMPGSPTRIPSTGNYARRSSSSNQDSGGVPQGMFVSATVADFDSDGTNFRDDQDDEYSELLASNDVREYRIHPSDSLMFVVRRNETGEGVEGSAYFLLTNRARFHGLAFKVKTSNYAGYFVKPARGTVGPTSVQRVDVIINAPDAHEFNAHERELKDRFLIEVLFLDMSTYSQAAATEDDRQRKQLQRLWDESDAIDREKSVLTCQILADDEPVDPTQQTAQQARARLQKTQAIALSFNASVGPRLSTMQTQPPPPSVPPMRRHHPQPAYQRRDSDTDTFYA